MCVRLCWVGDGAVRPEQHASIQARVVDARGHDVPHRLVGRDQPVGHDAAVTAPPERLRAHDGDALLLTFFAQLGQPFTVRRMQRVIGIVVKALVVPEAVDLWRHVAAASTAPAQCGQVLVVDAEGRQRVGQRGLVELRVGARAGDGADVDHARDPAGAQAFDERVDAEGRMADGVDR